MHDNCDLIESTDRCNRLYSDTQGIDRFFCFFRFSLSYYLSLSLSLPLGIVVISDTKKEFASRFATEYHKNDTNNVLLDDKRILLCEVILFPFDAYRIEE
jgi:hypothetical protein